MSRSTFWKPCLVASLIVVGLSWLTSIFWLNRGGLRWFSPYTLKVYGQTECTIFGGDWPLYRSFPVEDDHELLAFLIREDYVDVIPAADDRREWMFHWNDAWRDGDSTLYRNVLRPRLTPSMIEWTQQNPDLARVYWSEGFKRLRGSDRYTVWAGRQILTRGMNCKTLPELQAFIATHDREFDEWRREETVHDVASKASP